MIVHPLAPIYDDHSKILILGSFPSVRSRESGFYYGHPQNRFWRVLAAIFGGDLPETAEDKRAFLLKNGIALWDVLASCEIKGSSDASIREEVPNDVGKLLERAPIERIFVNGKTAEKYYKKHLEKPLGRACRVLPSTSPANAAMSLDRLINAWREILENT